MDPVTVLSLACNILTLIDACLKTGKACRELYKHGQTKDDTNTSEIANVIATMSIPEKTNHRDDDEVRQIALKTKETAEELLSLFQHLQAKPGSWHSTLRVAAFSLWNKRKMKALASRLIEYRKALDTARIAHLCKQVDGNNFLVHGLDQKLHDLIQNHADTFHELSIGFQDFAQALTALRESVDRGFEKQQVEIRNVAATEHRKTRELVVSKNANTMDEIFTQRLLSSLSFDGMYERQEAVKAAHQDTFRWILDQEGKAFRGNVNLVDWLEHGAGVFWIEGKPGSGKSTLMNFIYNEPTTFEYAKHWAGSGMLFMPAFFFWKAGSERQKSFASAMRTFAHHILSDVPDIYATFDAEGHWKRTGDINVNSDRRRIPSWTEDRLWSLLKFLAESMEVHARLCFFIDGLDECEDGADDLLRFITQFSNFHSVKFVISSRRHNSFDDQLPTDNKIQLHELTARDLNTYVTTKLNAFAQQDTLSEITRKDVETLASQIVRKAEGVFLWVVLVVKDISKGFRDRNSIQELEARIKDLPADLELLFLRLLDRIQNRYHSRTAQIIQIILAAQPRGLYFVDFVFAMDSISTSRKGRLARSFYKAWSHHHQEKWLEKWFQIAGAEVNALCDNFLQYSNTVKSSEPNKSWDSQRPQWAVQSDTSSNVVYFLDPGIEFLHRTVRDFFNDSSPGREFLRRFTPRDFVPYAALVIGRLWGTWIMTATDPSRRYFVQECMRMTIRYSLLLQKHYLQVLPSVESEMEECFQSLAQILCKRQNKHPEKHWSTFILFNQTALRFSQSNNATKQPRIRVHDMNGALTAFGLGEYVKQRIKNSGEIFSKRYLTHLLMVTSFGAQMNPFEYLPDNLTFLAGEETLKSSLSLANELLRLGANPNLCLPCTSDWESPWQYFMYFFQQTENFEHFASGDQLKSVWKAAHGEILRTMNSYILHGADIEQRLPLPYPMRGYNYWIVQVKYDLSEVLDMYLKNSDIYTPDSSRLSLSEFLATCSFDGSVGKRIIEKERQSLAKFDFNFSGSFIVSGVRSPQKIYDYRKRLNDSIFDSQERYPDFRDFGDPNPYFSLSLKQSLEFTRVMKVSQSYHLGPDLRKDLGNDVVRVYRQICLDLDLDDSFWIQSKSLMASISDPLPMRYPYRRQAKLFEDEYFIGSVKYTRLFPS